MSNNVIDDYILSVKNAENADKGSVTYVKTEESNIERILKDEIASQMDAGFVKEFNESTYNTATQFLSDTVGRNSDDTEAINVLTSGSNFVRSCLLQEFSGLQEVVQDTLSLVRDNICKSSLSTVVDYISKINSIKKLGISIVSYDSQVVNIASASASGTASIDAKSKKVVDNYALDIADSGRRSHEKLEKISGFFLVYRDLGESDSISWRYNIDGEVIVPEFVEDGYSFVLYAGFGDSADNAYTVYLHQSGSVIVTYGPVDKVEVNDVKKDVEKLDLFSGVASAKRGGLLAKEFISLTSQQQGGSNGSKPNIFKEVSEYAKEFVKNSENSPVVTALTPLYKKYLISDTLASKPSCNPFSFGTNETKDAICGYIKFLDVSVGLLDEMGKNPNVDTRLLTQSRDQAVSINPDSGIQMHKAELRALSDRKNAAEKAMRVANSMVNSLKGATETNTWLVRHGVVKKVWSFKEATDITNYGDWLTGWSDNWLNVRYTKKNRGVLSCSAIRNKLNRRANIIANGLTDSNSISPEAKAEQLYNKYKALVERMINMLRELQMQVYFFQDLPFSVRNSFRSFVESVVGSFARYSRAQSPIKPVDAARMMYLYRVLIIDLPEEASASLYSQFMVDSSKYGAGFYFDDKSRGTPSIKTYTLLDVALNLLGEMKASYVAPDTNPYISVPVDSNPFFMDSTRYEMDRFSGATLPQNLASGKGLSLNLVEPKIDPITPSETNVKEEPIYKFGDKSDGLKAVQTNLKLFLEKTGATLQGVAIHGNTQIGGKDTFSVDGDFGVDTRNAVGFFQNYVGLDKTYYVDKTTLLALNKYIADNK